jgi:hypothetical protein
MVALAVILFFVVVLVIMGGLRWWGNRYLPGQYPTLFSRRVGRRRRQ